MKNKNYIYLRLTEYDSKQFVVELDKESSKTLITTILEVPQKVSLCRISAINHTITKKISAITGLEYLSEAPPDGRVCFAESSELRDEFKTHFTFTDLVSYVTASLHLIKEKSGKAEFSVSQKIDYPKNTDLFWEYTGIGKKIIEKNM